MGKEKPFTIALISFALIIGLYEPFVRCFNVVRFFFGMRPRHGATACGHENS
jgi:hypothetical protein